MTCPDCGGKVDTKDTRHTPDNETLRLKECQVCGKRFKTIEFEAEDDWTLDRLWKMCDRGAVRKRGGWGVYG